MREELIGSLGRLDAQKPIAVLVKILDNPTGPDRDKVRELFFQLGWRPETIEQVMKVFIDLQDCGMLELFWPETQKLLHSQLEDPLVEFRKRVRILIWLGHEESLQPLWAALEQRGTKEIAQWYYNSGNDRLAAGALQWVKVCGYELPPRTSSYYELKWPGAASCVRAIPYP